MQHYSYSKKKTYENCPRSFKLQYIEKREQQRSTPLMIGSAVHAGAAAYVAHLVAERLQTDVTYDLIPEAMAIMVKEKKTLTAQEWAEAAEILEKFKDTFVIDPEKYVEHEKMQKIGINGYMWWGVMDLLEVDGDTAIIEDFKTDRAIRSQADVNKDPQLRSYAWMVNAIYGYEKILARLRFVRYGVVVEVELTMSDIIQASSEITAAIEAMESDKEFLPTPGHHCSYCSWADDCPAIGGAPVLVKDAEAAEQMASEILVLEQQVKERKAALSDWCVTNGNVVVGGEVFGHLPSKDGGWSITDKAVFAERLQVHSLDPWDYFNVNGTKLKSIRTAKKFAPVLADIEDLLERDLKTSFTHRKDDAA